jgi:hypothetical protein
MTKSILLDGTSRRLFEQQAPAALNLNTTRNEQGDYVDPLTHGMYLGFLVGHVTGLSHGLRVAKCEFEQAYTKAADQAMIAQSEIGTSAGLAAIDLAVEASDHDRAAVASSLTGFSQTLMSRHGEMVRTMTLENHLANFKQAS